MSYVYLFWVIFVFAVLFVWCWGRLPQKGAWLSSHGEFPYARDLAGSAPVLFLLTHCTICRWYLIDEIYKTHYCFALKYTFYFSVAFFIVKLNRYCDMSIIQTVLSVILECGLATPPNKHPTHSMKTTVLCSCTGQLRFSQCVILSIVVYFDKTIDPLFALRLKQIARVTWIDTHKDNVYYFIR